MGRQFVQFKCHHCNHCCKDVICLPTPFDVKRIVEETGANPYAFIDFITSAEIDDFAEDDPTWLDVNGERYLMALRRDRHGCYFLQRKTGHCTIYEARPALCRLYPFMAVDDDEGTTIGFALHEDVGCPRHRDGRVPVAPLLEIFHADQKRHAEYRALVKAFNAKQFGGKKPDQFFELFLDLPTIKRYRLQRRAQFADRAWKDR
jgi:Fe-S-cluster containining protein